MKKICVHKWTRDTEDERERRGELEGKELRCRRAEAPRLGTTAITAAAKSLWIHLHCLMETSQQALKPLRGGLQALQGEARVCVLLACAQCAFSVAFKLQ